MRIGRLSMSLCKATIVYDGECPFCIKQVKSIQDMDHNDCFDYVPRQAPELVTCFPTLKEMDFEEGMRLVDPNGCIYVGADAVYQIARRLPKARLIAWLYCIPVCKQIAQILYRWIAVNRKRLGQTCRAEPSKISASDGEAK